MDQGKYEVVIAKTARDRYQYSVLPYLFENFSVARATEIDERILNTAATLSSKPFRGRIEEHLSNLPHNFRFILYKETKQFELKIVYYIEEKNDRVYVTDFFPTRMNPSRMEVIK
ncbi:hypothetical protein [Reichenbachiella sp. MSK19-1]|uniref:hypothetical protein n=1 Tax=Reichenbachiella sp. MSK19-1 TaxID=1897631 RepID=UPI000E6D0613|nr:hypothetical protein [Reichenbachiella sp. MSK19-1]RJE70584.1 hypothetical protein BGP76_10885 [Reichenbachiella sp. MSK19-1]